jgi:hypothetical protein
VVETFTSLINSPLLAVTVTKLLPELREADGSDERVPELVECSDHVEG